MSALVADREQIARFVHAMFRHAPPHTFISLRAFFDKGAPREGVPYWPFDAVALTPENLAAVIDAATRRATWCAQYPRRVVFCPPLAIFKSATNAATDNLAAALAISVECDERAREAVATLAGIIGAPTLAVLSGGRWINPDTGEVTDKLHAHWRLSRAATTGEDHAAVKLARELACAIVGSDPTSNSPVHPMRWPGSWHRKAEEPRLARIDDRNSDDAAEVDLDDALEKLTAVALERGLARYADDESGSNSERTAPIERVAVWISGIPNPHPDDDNWDWWNKVGMALHAATDGSPGGLALFHEWSSRSAKYDAAATARRWQHWHKHPATRMGAGTLCYLFTEFWCHGTGNDAGDAHYDNP
jgi:hypothetical protein